MTDNERRPDERLALRSLVDPSNLRMNENEKRACFSAGAEIGCHKNGHPYQFMDSEPMGVFQGRVGWSVREELRLLDAIELYGFGNWEDISGHIETRTAEGSYLHVSHSSLMSSDRMKPESRYWAVAINFLREAAITSLSDGSNVSVFTEAKDQYVGRYLDGNIGRMTWDAAAGLRSHLVDQTNQPDNGPLSPAQTARLPPLDATPEEATQLGYRPQRDDFEREYDNMAESLVSPLFINALEDDDIDTALKMAQVDMYTRRLRERARRRRVSRDFQLVSQFFSASRKDRLSSRKKLTKEEKEFYERMRVFTQFHTAQEHDQFLQNLHKERELKLRLNELAKYRHHGLTHHEECAHFEQECLQHEDRKPVEREKSEGAICSTDAKSVARPTSLNSNSNFSSSNSSSRAPLDSGVEGVVEIGGEGVVRPDSTKLLGYHLLTPCEINDYLKKGFKKDDSLVSPSTGPENHILQYLMTNGLIAAS
uniref:Transcriptional adapter n=1 Tax=Timema poppense TaxID=170557 RepID=A0A7R9CU04_TIMPO|nr:unnamed protein product [Timema poppensis]